MRVDELLKNGFVGLELPEPEREVFGVYIGDLLSWVMGRARAGDAWITIMSNENTVAVAALAEVACVIAAEGVEMPDGVRKTAREKGINLLSFSGSAYEAAVKLNSLL